jgi:hypothetical protein
MYLTPSACSALDENLGASNSCGLQRICLIDAADAEAISAFEISMMNLCEFL